MLKSLLMLLLVILVISCVTNSSLNNVEVVTEGDKIFIKDQTNKKWDVTHTPSILFDPDNYSIRWLGAPLGEEGRIFAEALIMMGYGMHNLSEASEKVLNKIGSKRQIKLFISPT